VNLGAGFDTRAYRLPALSGVPVWEVDQSDNIKAKRLRLTKVLGEIPSNVTLVEIDFDHEILRDALMQHGYFVDMKTLFCLGGCHSVPARVQYTDHVRFFR
jgi:methyltransferase (TIGR00027 family)